MICARNRRLALVVVSYNCRSSVTWVSDKGGRVRGVAIVPFRKDGQHHITPTLYRKYFLEAFSLITPVAHHETHGGEVAQDLDEYLALLPVIAHLGAEPVFPQLD